MKCPQCDTRIRRNRSECPDCGYALSDWEEQPADPSDRPPDVRLAVKLLAGAAAYDWFAVFDAWSKLGMEWVSLHRVAWIRPTELAIWCVLIAMTWLGNSWARTMVLVLIGWHALQTITGIALVVSVTGGGILLMLAWASLAVELLAAYFLLQISSLEWFRG
jgi:hypothetical protein